MRMMATARRLPVVVVLGATGTGKSKLAIELGRKFNGEIISADSMQIYEGLDIITNKVTAEEQHQCGHHLISYVNPFSNTSNTVVQFRDKALPIIETLLDKGKLPIIVGGTNYYIESLLWKFLIDKKAVDETKEEAPPVKKARISESFSEYPDRHEDEDRSSKSDASYPGQHSAVDGDSSKTAGETNKKVLCQDSENISPPDHDCDSVPQSTTDACSSNPDSTPSDVRVSDDAVGNTEDRTVSETITDTWKRPDRGGKFTDVDSRELHNQLMLVDPVSAQKIHPHNRRKVIRALEVYEDHGVPMSEIFKAQHSAVGDSALSGPLRYQHTCIFWIQCDKTVLDVRLDRRVDGMMEQGLLKELHDFHHQYRQAMHDKHGNCDYTLGMFQSIGFKEFHNYLLLPEEERNTVKGRKLMDEGLESLKLATRQYARRQIKWIRNRFLKRPGPGVPPVYGVDSTDVAQWTDNVFNPACDTLMAIMQGETPSLTPLKLEGEVTKHVHNICDVCGGRVFTTQMEWDAHLSGRKHKRAYSKQQKLARESVLPGVDSSASHREDLHQEQEPQDS